MGGYWRFKGYPWGYIVRFWLAAPQKPPFYATEVSQSASFHPNFAPIFVQNRRFRSKSRDFRRSDTPGGVCLIPPGGIVDTPGGYGSSSKSPVSAGKHAASAASRPLSSAEQASACAPEPPATVPPRRSLGPQATPNHIIPTRTEREAAEPSDPQNGTRISTYGLDSVHKTPGGNV